MSDAPKDIFNLLFKMAQAAYRAGGVEEAFKDFVQGEFARKQNGFGDSPEQRWRSEERNRRAAKSSGWYHNIKFYELEGDLGSVIDNATRSFEKKQKLLSAEIGETIKQIKVQRNLLLAGQVQLPLLDAKNATRFFEKIETQLSDLEDKLTVTRIHANSACRSFILERAGDEFGLEGIDELCRRAEKAIDRHLEHLKKYFPQERDSLSKLDQLLIDLRNELAKIDNSIAIAGLDPKRSVVSQFKFGMPLNGADLEIIGSMLEAEWTDSFAAMFADPKPIEQQNSHHTDEQVDFILALFERLVLNAALRQMALSEASALRSKPDVPPARLDRAILERAAEVFKTLQPGLLLTNTSQLDRFIDAVVLSSQCEGQPWAEFKFTQLIDISQLPSFAGSSSDARYKHLLYQLGQLEEVLCPAIGKSTLTYRQKFFTQWHLALVRKLFLELTPLKPSQALAAWDSYLAEKQAARNRLLALVSPIFQGLVAGILDHPSVHELNAIEKDPEVFVQVKHLDELARTIFANEIKSVLGKTDSYAFCMAVQTNEKTRLQFCCSAEGMHRFQRLIFVLEMNDRDRAAYFSTEETTSEASAFDDCVASIRANRYFFSRGAFAFALTARHFEKAQTVIDDWLTVAPVTDLTSKLRAFDHNQTSITNWGVMDRFLAIPGTAAIGLDFSEHVTTELSSSAQAIPFEVNRYIRDALPEGDLSIAMLQVEAQNECPWQGAFEDIDIGVDIIGLSSLVLALNHHKKQKTDAMSHSERDLHNSLSALAEAHIYLTVLRTVDRELKTRTFSRSIPIIVGSHDFGVFPTVVYTTHPTSTP